MEMGQVDVSIILLTYNGIRYIDEVLRAIYRQQTSFPFEVIAIDSGSSDGTVDVLMSYPVRFYPIDKKQFGHGKTRNYGAELSRGQYLVFLTQDATPADEFWLEEMIRGFSLDPRVGCVFGKQIARPECDPFTRRDLMLHFEMFSKSDEPLVQYVEDTPEGRALYHQNPLWYGFNSNVNSALRKEAWAAIRFRDVIYTEDQVMGRDIIVNGWKKVYMPKAAVIHSHSYSSFFRYFQRFFDELRGMHMAFGYTEDVSLATLIPACYRIARAEAQFIFSETDYRRHEKCYWVYFRWRWHIARRLGAYFGCRHDKLPHFLRRFFSLEKNPGPTMNACSKNEVDR
ncbi:glycosyltransferase family 2 protein [Brevibacillus borstelensis]|jgi:rhamnosyltransferase|uniref:Family 2 glycosyl transferase n=2 Tax=Brevibacillus TaxID=55080 RepID=M8DII4_9BACL|nr:family 2 glycosyl transferase [Brevibacillus borstelensis AK1]RNB61051.1 glycosyltransferase family 2 protein [Brevibacillus borstelensis]GED52539.1 rhamnosyltransferase [Brevibacillus borstelensis]